MQKKYIILISVAILVILGVLGVFFLTNLKGGPVAEEEPARGLTIFRKKKVEKDIIREKDIVEEEFIESPEGQIEEPIMKLIQITKTRTAGAIAVQKEKEKSIPETDGKTEKKEATAVRYVEAATGNVYETFVDNIAEKRISDTVIPGIHDAFFINGGQAVVLRYLRDDGRTIESFLGQIKKEVLGGDASIELKGSFLPQNIIDLSVSPDFKNFFYLFEFGDGVVGINASSGDGKKSQIFDSPFTEWISVWASPRLITLTTKASFKYGGSLYALDPQNKSFNRILGNIFGLTTLASPNGKFVLYSGSDLGLKIFDLDKKVSTDLGLRGLPEKCVWSSDSENTYCAIPVNPPAGEYPDDWYQGSVSFNDVIWKINTKTNAFKILVNPIGVVNKNIDGVRLFLDQKENYLFFLNKKDSTLWSLNISVGQKLL